MAKKSARKPLGFKMQSKQQLKNQLQICFFGKSINRYLDYRLRYKLYDLGKKLEVPLKEELEYSLWKGLEIYEA